MLRVISLGAGVQSTTMALMAARGDLPMPDCAIFADTGWEPAAVYRHLEWLEQQLPFQVHRVERGNIRDDLLRCAEGHWADVPAFVKNPDGSIGLVNRQCTKQYKIRPIRQKVRNLLGLERKASPTHAVAEQWIGISLDEAIRMKPSKEAWQAHIWPLIELRMSRRDCLRWLAERQYPEPPKSSCIGCPYHSNDQWLALSPEEFAEAVEIDSAIRHSRSKGELYLHRQCVPLDQVDFSTAEDRGQLNLFLNECEGMCGV
ncbi:MAG: hypothetical protein E5V63_04280 [Mesorhizobium sp.]|nr:MAG: hypothetical protein E5V63_04280 [Mesorhizobium sp.]